MRYMRVTFKYHAADEPVVSYHELDDERNEIRRVEVFADDHIEYGSAQDANSELSLEPIPEVAYINEDPQFDATEIAIEEFEQIWAKRGTSGT